MTSPEMNPTTTEPERSAPLFPPGYLLLLSAAGFLLALFHGLTQPAFGVAGWGGLGVGVLTLFAWALMSPEQARSLLTGRAAQFGGTAVIVTVVFLVALVVIYVVIRGLGIRQDMSNFEVFSLTDQARDIVRTLANDPTTPPMKIIGFFSAQKAASQDRISVLLDDFVQTSGGRITYEFINPDRQPQIATQYEARDGDFFVVPLDEAGVAVVDSKEKASGSDQQQLLDAMVKASSSGDFRFYFPRFADGLDFDDTSETGGSILKNDLVESYGWTAEEISFFDPNNVLVKPPETAPDGQVLVIPGGSTPLNDDELKVITDYLDKGGDMVLFAGINPDGEVSLATAENLGNYLFEKYGVRFRNDIVYDLNNAVNSPFIFIAAGFSADHFITSGYSEDSDALLFTLAHSIEIAPEALPDVKVTIISTTTSAGFSKPALDPNRELTQDDLTPNDDDPQGEIPVAAAVENTKTGSRIVLFGSESIAQNAYRQLDPRGIRNTDAARRALFWTAGYEQYRQIPSLELVRPQQVPLIVTATEMNTINLITILILPFGVLGFGILQWWLRRERAA